MLPAVLGAVRCVSSVKFLGPWPSWGSLGGLVASLWGLWRPYRLVRVLRRLPRRVLWVILARPMVALRSLAGGLAVLAGRARVLCSKPSTPTWRADTAASLVCLASNRGRKHQKRSARGRKWACFRMIWRNVRVLSGSLGRRRTGRAAGGGSGRAGGGRRGKGAGRAAREPTPPFTPHGSRAFAEIGVSVVLMPLGFSDAPGTCMEQLA